MSKGFSKRCECGEQLGPFELEPGKSELRCPKCSRRTTVPESSDPNAFDIPALLVEVKRLRKDNQALVEENFLLSERLEGGVPRTDK